VTKLNTLADDGTPAIGEGECSRSGRFCVNIWPRVTANTDMPSCDASKVSQEQSRGPQARSRLPTWMRPTQRTWNAASYDVPVFSTEESVRSSAPEKQEIRRDSRRTCTQRPTLPTRSYLPFMAFEYGKRRTRVPTVWMRSSKRKMNTMPCDIIKELPLHHPSVVVEGGQAFAVPWDTDIGLCEEFLENEPVSRTPFEDDNVGKRTNGEVLSWPTYLVK
jgi:hypothetical protein